MSSIKTVAVAGASGELGSAIVNALLASGFTVSVLVRPDSQSTYPPGVRTLPADYSNAASLEAALQGQDALVSAVGFSAFRSQEALIDAAVAAGVKRILPSEWGTDPEVLAARQLPVFGDKVRIEQYVRERTRGTGSSYTLVCNNEFLDWDLDHAFGVDLRARKITIFDGGDVVHTATPLPFVARGVVAVLQGSEEKTADRVVRLHGAALTQNRLLAMIQKQVGQEGWDVTHASTFEREAAAYRILKDTPEDWMGWGLPMIQIAVWGQRFGGDFSRKNDNALLGLEELTDADIEAIIAQRV